MSEKKKERFFETLLEISNQIKINSELIDTDKVFKLIDLILQIHSEKNRVFV